MIAAAFRFGLFAPERPLGTKFYDRAYFFDHIWSGRRKWAVDIDLAPQAFKVSVMVRFRPGELSNDGLRLPLSQFLKVRRRRVRENKGALMLGNEEPLEFLDPFLNVIMKHPVLLPSSMRVMDRAVAMQCIRRGGRDPFDGSPLSEAMLVPQPELLARINAWQTANGKYNIDVGVDEAASLLDSDTVDPGLLDIILSAQQLEQTAHRAKLDARNGGITETVHDYPSTLAGTPANLMEETATASEHTAHQYNNLVNGDRNQLLDSQVMPAFFQHSSKSSAHEGQHEEEDLRRWSRATETTRVLQINAPGKFVALNVSGAGLKRFHYNEVFDGSSSQEQLYQFTAHNSVQSVLNGYNTCVLVYGQTGSGKTHTMFGPDHLLETSAPVYRKKRRLPEDSGIVTRSFVELLEARDRLSKQGTELSISTQFIEIYQEQATDLLTGNRVEIRRTSGEVAGALTVAVESLEDCMELLQSGHTRKRFAATAMNDHSSRSHSILLLTLTQINRERFPDVLVKSHMHLVDLAGSERVKKSKAQGKQMTEAVGINSSLLVLGKCIERLVSSATHVPFYESKLTTLLKSAFGGNSRTTAIIACRPDQAHGDETLQSLRFGERCGMISNTALTAASSVEGALKVIQRTLHRVASQVKGLEERGKHHLPSYAKLKNSFEELGRKQQELIRGNQRKLNRGGGGGDTIPSG